MTCTIEGTATDYDTSPVSVVARLNQGRWSPRVPTGPSGMNTSLLQAQLMNRCTITTPSLLYGIRCYVDASSLPDQPSMMPRQAGLVVLIVNTQVQPTQTIYINACWLHFCAHGRSRSPCLSCNCDCSDINYLSDYEQLVHFLHAANQSNSPDWRIKHFTQLFSNHSRCRESKIFKINGRLNTTADALPRQALSDSYLWIQVLSLLAPMSIMYTSALYYKLYIL